jgi:hypothetical protein
MSKLSCRASIACGVPTSQANGHRLNRSGNGIRTPRLRAVLLELIVLRGTGNNTFLVVWILTVQHRISQTL